MTIETTLWGGGEGVQKGERVINCKGVKGTFIRKIFLFTEQFDDLQVCVEEI